MSNELQTVEKNEIVQASGYAATTQNFKELFKDDTDGMELRLDKIKIPSGGGIAYEIPGDDAENPDLVKDFDAVILYHHNMQSYYKEKYTGGSVPPDCASLDGVSGICAETGELVRCANCENAKFGSGENKGKACKTKRRLLIIRENELLPTMLTVPTGSLKKFNEYIQKLLKAGKKSCQVVTRFSLSKAQNKNGISFSQVVCNVARDLTTEEKIAISQRVEQAKAFAGKIVEDDYSGQEE